MTKYKSIIEKSRLFKSIKYEDIVNMAVYRSAVDKKYRKGEYVLRTGDKINTLYMVAEGKIHILKEDYWGNRSILAEIESGEIFGEAYACMEGVPLQVNAEAVKDSVIIEMNIENIFNEEIISSHCNLKFIKNLVSVIAERNLHLTNKLECMAQRSTRDKIMRYLSMESQKNKSGEFNIPFNRQQLADYLCVDRSAMSKELCKMRDEKILEFNKNYFKLL